MKTVAIVLALLLLTACGGTTGAAVQEKTKIGVIAPLTGGAAELGQHVQRGIDLANEHLGDKYRIIYEDDKCVDAVAGLNAARKLTTIDGVKHVIGPLCTPPYMAVASVFNEQKVAFMHTSGSTEAHVEAAGEYGIAGMSSAQHDEMAALAAYIHDELGIKKMGLLTWNQEWALQYRLGFVKAYEKLGGEIVADELFTTESTEYRTEVLKVVSSDAEGVLVLGLNFQVAKIVQELRTIDKELPIFGQLDNEDPSFYEAVGSAGEGMQWTLPHIDLADEEVASFLKTYRERYGDEPNYYALVGYDSLKMYDDAIQACASDTKCAVDHILAADFPGISGEISFEDGIIKRDFGIRELRQGRSQAVQ